MIRVSFAYNHHADGRFTGSFPACDFEVDGGETAVRLVGPETAIEFRKTRVNVLAAWFDFSERRDWVGNWCWSAVTLSLTDARRLLSLLLENEWVVEERVDGSPFEDLLGGP